MLIHLFFQNIIKHVSFFNLYEIKKNINFSNSEKIKQKIENCCYITNIYTQNLFFSFKTAQKIKVHIDEIWRNTHTHKKHFKNKNSHRTDKQWKQPTWWMIPFQDISETLLPTNGDISIHTPLKHQNQPWNKTPSLQTPIQRTARKVFFKFFPQFLF